MLSDFRRHKLTRLFEMRDFDKDGYLERSDYTMVALRLADMFRVEPGSPEYQRLQTGFWAAWERICQALAKSPERAKVSLEEYLQVQTDYLAQRKDWERDVLGLVSRVVERADRDRDGKVTIAEFAGFACAYGLTVDEAINTAQQLDLDEDGFLLNANLLRYVEQFYYSDNPDDVGNRFVGPY